MNGKTASRSRARGASLAGAVLIAAAGCSGTVGTPPPSALWVDPSYKPNLAVAMTIAIAPVPLTGELADRADQGLERAFLDTPGCLVRGQPAYFRQRMNGDRKLVQIVNRILADTYSPQDLAAGTGLRRILTPKELEDLRSVLQGSSLLFVPTALEVKSEKNRTAGRIAFRAYDLGTGKLLLMNSFARTLPQGGDAGARGLLIELILDVHRDFAKHLLSAP